MKNQALTIRTFDGLELSELKVGYSKSLGEFLQSNEMKTQPQCQVRRPHVARNVHASRTTTAKMTTKIDP
jgi:hypothetical protein